MFMAQGTLCYSFNGSTVTCGDEVTSTRWRVHSRSLDLCAMRSGHDLLSSTVTVNCEASDREHGLGDRHADYRVGTSAGVKELSAVSWTCVSETLKNSIWRWFFCSVIGGKR